VNVEPHVIVCGAGLTGLTTAWHLQQRGVRVTVVEAATQVGGVIQTSARDGYLVEHGPNSCMLTPELAQVTDALGLTPLVRAASPDAQRRYIVKGGTPLAVPMSPVAMLRSPLLSLSAKLRVLREPFVARRTLSGDESVAAFITRRLGNEPLSWAVDPFVSGVYAGDPTQLSVSHAFPRLAALEREHGSLIRGMLAGARRARSHPSGAVNPARATLMSFRDGMASLSLALAQSVGSMSIRTGTRVVAMQRAAVGCEVTIECDGVRQQLHADAVVSTLPLHALTSIALPDAAAADIAELTRLPYPAVASLALGFARRDVSHALDGFGCLVPSAERRNLLGVLFSSTLFDGRAPQDHVLLTCFLGGVKHPATGMADTGMLLSLVLPELRDLLGVHGEPTFVQHTTWPQAIPQYNLGHDAFARAAERVEAAMPGFVIDGQFRRGVSVGDCVASSRAIAERADTIVRARHGAAGGTSPATLPPARSSAALA
jgi:protoporphyrinogen/coproporphyrinogen III oxidase